jgi:multiple sugar transport system permease protein
MSDRLASLASRVMVVFLFVLYLGPMYVLVATSLKSKDQLGASASNPIFTPTLDAYHQVINEDLFRAMASSLQIAVGTTLLVLVIGVPAAYYLARARGWMVPMLLAGLVLLQMPPSATTVIPLFRVVVGWGLANSLLGVIIAISAALTPFAILLMRPFFMAVPREIEEAAQIDGASRIRALLSVVLPVASNGIITVAILTFMIAWGEFLYSIVFLTDPLKYPVSALLSQQITMLGTQWPALMALSLLTALPVIAIYLVLQRRVIDGLSTGAVK